MLLRDFLEKFKKINVWHCVLVSWIQLFFPFLQWLVLKYLIYFVKFPYNVAHSEGLEPPTPWFEAKYSIQLSYECMVGRIGFEPMTQRLKAFCSTD